MTRAFYIPEDASAGKAAILEAALQLFTSRGLNGTSIRDIADAASLSNPALYKHFASKEAVALELFIACYGQLVARVQAAMDAVTSADEKLQAYVATFAALYDECPAAPIFVNDHLRELWPHAKARLPAYTMVSQAAALVVQLRKERKSRSRVPPDLAVAAILGTLAQCARFAYFGELKGPAKSWTEPLLELFDGMVSKC